MTFNVRCAFGGDGLDNWEFRRPRTAEFLRRHQPDLVGLQEPTSAQLEDLLAEMPGYAALGVAREDARDAGEHSAVLYDATRLRALRSDSFWLSDTPDRPSATWGNRCIRICTWVYFKDLESGSFFYVFNAHLDHESQPSREKAAELMVYRIQERGVQDPVMVMGDFNVGEDNPILTTFRHAGFRDSFRDLHPDATDVGTYSGFADDYEPDKIDYILVDADFETIDAAIVKERVDGRWPSDHAAVTATVSFRQKG